MIYLPIILAAVFLSIVVNSLLKRSGIPTVIGYIITGVAVSSMFDLHNQFESLSHIAEFGIVFLMFTIGLEFSFKDLIAMRKEVLLFGSMQLLITATLSGAVAYSLGVSAKAAIIIGMALALSSTAIVLKALNEKGEMHLPYGKKSVGILLFQDLAVIPILLMISIFASQSSDLTEMLQTIAIDAIMVIIILAIIGKYLLDPLLEWITHTDSEEIFLATVLFLVIGSAELAHLFGFTYSLGAFLAGMLLAETHFKYQIESELIPFRDLLMGLFFVTVGMQIKLPVILENIGPILLVAVGIMLLKSMVIFGFLRFFSRLRTAFKTGLALAQVGEFALAIFSLALADRLLEPQTVQILFGATVLSMIASVFIIADIRRISDWLYPEPEVVPVVDDKNLSDHIVVCGYGPMGRNVINLLKGLEVTYVILEHDIQLVQLGQSRGEPIYFANAANLDILKAFQVQKAASVIVAVGNARHLRLICEALNRISEKINVVIKAANRVEEEMLEDLHIDHIVLQSEEMADLLVKKAMACKIV